MQFSSISTVKHPQQKFQSFIYRLYLRGSTITIYWNFGKQIQKWGCNLIEINVSSIYTSFTQACFKFWYGWIYFTCYYRYTVKYEESYDNKGYILYLRPFLRLILWFSVKFSWPIIILSLTPFYPNICMAVFLNYIL